MNTDFRISVHIWQHPKFLMLGDALGFEGQLCLLKLFSFASVNRPDGCLYKLSDRTIERSCEFTGESGGLITTLLDLEWLERDGDGVLSIHDWRIHNPWACNAVARSDKGRKAAAARWSKDESEEEENAQSNATSMPGACPEHATSNAGGNAKSNAPLLSSPIPSLPDQTTPQSPPSANGQGGGVSSQNGSGTRKSYDTPADFKAAMFADHPEWEEALSIACLGAKITTTREKYELSILQKWYKGIDLPTIPGEKPVATANGSTPRPRRPMDPFLMQIERLKAEEAERLRAEAAGNGTAAAGVPS